MSENKMMGGDERLKKSSGAAVRADRDEADAQRVEQDGTALTMEERRRLMRSEWVQEVLPTPPARPGWHFCWLSTTNASDPIHKRIQRGYEPVRAAEIPGFMQYKVDQGEYEGCIACNEMLLFKLPQELYEEYMMYVHHDRPLEEEEVILDNAKPAGEDTNGRPLGQVEGFETLGRRVRKPTF